MITGFFTFVLWLVMVSPIIAIYKDDKSFKITKGKVFAVIYPVALGGFLIWIYNNYWEYLVMFFGIILVIVCGIAAFTRK